MNVLLTGGAGFIGSHVADRLLRDGHEVTCIDNFDPFYSEDSKKTNIQAHLSNPHYQLIDEDITNTDKILNWLKGTPPDLILHLAAKAGVRPSISNPQAYAHTNVQGTISMLEIARKLNVPKFIFASSSSVYGSNPNIPWNEADLALSPISPYASSKIAAEFFGKTYCSLYSIDFTALRFFTVFGPRQRPDLAIHKFFSALLKDEPITVYGDGTTRRDYTYIDDIVNGIYGAIEKTLAPGQFKVYNLGNSGTVTLNELIAAIEKVVGKKFKIKTETEQPGDVSCTYANISSAKKDLSFSPSTTLHQGLEAFYNWYKKTQVS
jgi:UDP-glucuronate 4-epimerase